MSRRRTIACQVRTTGTALHAGVPVTMVLSPAQSGQGVVFRRADLNCMSCHAVAGAAGGVGPELSAVGSSSPVDYLINSVMVPDQAIKEEFVTKVVQTADGRVFHGIVADKELMAPGNRPIEIVDGGKVRTELLA